MPVVTLFVPTKTSLDAEKNQLEMELKQSQQTRAEGDRRRKQLEAQVQDLSLRFEESERAKVGSTRSVYILSMQAACCVQGTLHWLLWVL